MKTPVSRPTTSALELSTANGEIQDSSGVSGPPENSSTTANISRAPTWKMISTRCTIADSSVPSTQMVVIAAMMTSVRITFAAVESRRPVSSNMS